jgi:hypothetical protein
VLLVAVCIALALATTAAALVLVTRRLRARWLARKSMTRALGRREWRELDAHLNAIAQEEMDRSSREPRRPVGGWSFLRVTIAECPRCRGHGPRRRAAWGNGATHQHLTHDILDRSRRSQDRLGM